MVRLIAEVGREAGMRTVAEYVQDAPTLDILSRLGVDLAQGHFVGVPVDRPTQKDTPASFGSPISLEEHRARKGLA